MDDDLYWCALSYLGVNGYKNLIALKNSFVNLKNAWQWLEGQKIEGKTINIEDFSDLLTKNGITNYPQNILSVDTAVKIIKKIKNFSVEKLAEDLEKHKIVHITLDSPSYPRKLKTIKYPPLTIYLKGNYSALEYSLLAVVGSRSPSQYGQEAAKRILGNLVLKIGIVSGLAKGIDIISHRISLGGKGVTIGVSAGGLDKVYPAEHRKECKEILLNNGALVSEFPPGVSPLRHYFPIRNRIISGLSDAVLVVEAKEKSGALITADFALSQGKRLFSIPGSIFSNESIGANNLFKKGAFPVITENDIIDYFESMPKEMKKINENIGLIITTQKNQIHEESDRNKEEEENLSEQEKSILQLIPYDNPISLNMIIKSCNQSASVIAPIITNLEIRSLIHSVGGSLFKRR